MGKHRDWTDREGMGLERRGERRELTPNPSLDHNGDGHNSDGPRQG